MTASNHGARRRGSHRRGYTLLEALMASSILFAVVVAVISALTAGQQHALEAHQRIASTLAVDDLLGRISIVPYESLPSWDGYTEAVGEMTDLKGKSLPEAFIMLGREVNITTSVREIEELGINVRGRTITVTGFDTSSRTVAQVSRFIPEPQA